MPMNRVQFQPGLSMREFLSLYDGNTTIADEASYLWDVDDADRFARLALRYPHLLTHEEQVRWKLIAENGFLWRGSYDKFGIWRWNPGEASPMFNRLREQWEVFSAVARGEVPQSAPPTWQKERPKPKVPTGFEDMDDDIPF